MNVRIFDTKRCWRLLRPTSSTLRSMYAPEERDMVNFLKHTRKQMNQGLLKAELIPQFEKLLGQI